MVSRVRRLLSSSPELRYDRLKDVPRLTSWGSYRINMPWDYIDTWLERQSESCGVDLNPDFQRGHVWTRDQQIAYVEFRLRGGESGKEILFNAPGWHHGHCHMLQLVDGLQRLTAVRLWVANELPAWGKTRLEYPDAPSGLSGPDFIFYVNDLPDRASVLQWYLELNAAGTPHLQSELERVASLLEVARGTNSK